MSAAERAGVTVDTLVLRVGDSPFFNTEVGVRAFKVFSRINKPVNDGYGKEGKDVYFGEMKMVVATPIFRTVDERETRLEGFRTQRIRIEVRIYKGMACKTLPQLTTLPFFGTPRRAKCHSPSQSSQKCSVKMPT